MKQTLRFNTFETNSSSTHNIVIIPDKYMQQWENNELYYVRYCYGETKEFVEKNNNRLLYTKDEIIASGLLDDMPKREDFEDEDEFEEELEEYIRDSDFINKAQWDEHELECDHTEYTTEGGEKIHIMCEYGYDY